MSGLASASEANESIRQWMREFDARILQKLKAGFALVGVSISQDHANFLHATFIGALHLDMVNPSDESFERLSRAVATALHVVLPRTWSQRSAVTPSLANGVPDRLRIRNVDSFLLK